MWSNPKRRDRWLTRQLAVVAVIVCGPLAVLAEEPLLPGELPLQLGRELVGSSRLPRLLELEAAVRHSSVLPVALMRMRADEHNHYAPAWSADGRALVCLRAHVEEKTCKVLVFGSLHDELPQEIYADTLTYEHMPAWASAGRDWLVFASNRAADQTEQIHLWQRGREPRPLTQGPGLKAFAQLDMDTPSNRLLYRRIDAFELLTLSDDAPAATMLGQADEMRFGPQGDTVAIVRTTAAGQELAVRDLATQRELRLAGESRIRNPTWSPDGRWLAYWSQPLEAREWDLWTVGVTGEPVAARRMSAVRVDEDFRHVGPAWSADSRRIWCTSTQGTQSYYPLQWVAPDGQGQGAVEYETTLTTALDVAACPHPDHAVLAFVAIGRRPRDLYVVILNHH